MKISFDRWAVEQLKDRVRCRVEPSMTCLPLKGDPICSSCYESQKEETVIKKDHRHQHLKR